MIDTTLMLFYELGQDPKSIERPLAMGMQLLLKKHTRIKVATTLTTKLSLLSPFTNCGHGLFAKLTFSFWCNCFVYFDVIEKYRV